MREPRKTFAPVVLLGLGAGILSAVASSRTWIEYADADPRVITGRVATLTPMPSSTISASHRMEVMASGTTATTTARQLRKVLTHNTITAA